MTCTSHQQALKVFAQIRGAQANLSILVAPNQREHAISMGLILLLVSVHSHTVLGCSGRLKTYSSLAGVLYGHALS